ncbi:probable dolichyl pyrophosphate Glc1Man9GlcNAc2 alpha-1,3-glucosyltransferase [Cryptomeria japonica]|uniref:probable dolichyl pyrophosphate Glc1Man9GlcNAc2 alpha-1,3-glucosyltransferase n=1 Tax=Cryptomeria japonica TaxID=3369 RepID=UPI0025AC44DA|nr:probable dolichyl pyrophosphate Glc1Man9GlcNAc2 alpha-1,3-glucosyltransferase [Cryptomeria japonica]
MDSTGCEAEVMEEKEGSRRASEGERELLWMAGIASCIKVLAIPAYHSTDFEVHRHWMALTHSLPLSQWYADESSPWTLDYPPFFAWFEKFLSVAGAWVDAHMVDLHMLNYNAQTVIVFQRTTVIFADLLLYWALWRCCRKLSLEKQRLVYIAVVWSPALFIVDHVHFQYNGFLLGILLLSISYLLEGKDLMGGLLFAILLCFKHLFAVAAPVYFVYLLRHYCIGRYRVLRFFALGASVLSVLLLAFGPFLYHKQIPQVLKRLFPFGRGLCHAYWAPNVWALYNTADKVIAFVLRRFGFDFKSPTASLTGGLVGDFAPYVVLPQITPLVSLLLVVLGMLPCIFQIWRHPKQQHLVQWIAYAYMCGFMFGWHVHEKASLHFVIPLSLVGINGLKEAVHYMFLSIVSCYSMFPLLYEDKEYPVKVVLLTLQGVVMCRSFYLHLNKENTREHKASDLSPSKDGPVSQSGLVAKFCTKDILRNIELSGKIGQSYLWGLIIIEIWDHFLHPYLLNDKFPFLPLMIRSVYCAVGMFYSWIFQLSSLFGST